MKNIMLDLETFGQRPGAVIVAIGAVKFGGGALGDEFYARVAAQSGVDVGLHLDASTVLWWLGQDAVARAELQQPAEPIQPVLLEFQNFCAGQDWRVWGNGSDFDNALLAAAYHACLIPLPWKFSNNRCYRTLKSLWPQVVMERTGTYHNALDDARSQARHALQLCPEL